MGRLSVNEDTVRGWGPGMHRKKKMSYEPGSIALCFLNAEIVTGCLMLMPARLSCHDRLSPSNCEPTRPLFSRVVRHLVTATEFTNTLGSITRQQLTHPALLGF